MKSMSRFLPLLFAFTSCASDTIPGPGPDMAHPPAGNADLAAAPDLASSQSDLSSASHLAATGIVKGDCGPTDGPAMRFFVGVPSQCTPAQSAAPTAEFYSWTSRTPAAGQRWTFIDGGANQSMSVTFCPRGDAGPPCAAPASATLAVDSVSGDMVGVTYTFTTREGVFYGGTATVVICPSMPLCG